MILTRTAASIAIIAAVTIVACKGSKSAGEDCSWGVTCPSGSFCHELSQQCVTAEQLTACAGEDDYALCTYSDEHGVCLGGACVGPTPVFQGQIGEVAQNTNALFWTSRGSDDVDSSTIVTMPFSTHHSEELVATQMGIQQVAANDESVFWFGDGEENADYGIFRKSLTDGQTQLIYDSYTDFECDELLATQERVFIVTEYGTPETEWGDYFVWTRTDGSDVEGFGFLYCRRTYGHTADGTGFFYLQTSTCDYIAPPDHLYVKDTTTYEATRIGWAHDLSGLRSFALTSGDAYVAAPGGISTIPLNGGPPTTFLSDEPDADSLAANEDHLYWIRKGGPGLEADELVRAPLGGGAPVVLAWGASFSGPLLFSTTHVYWLSRGDPEDPLDDAILRMIK